MLWPIVASHSPFFYGAIWGLSLVSVFARRLHGSCNSGVFRQPIESLHMVGFTVSSYRRNGPL